MLHVLSACHEVNLGNSGGAQLASIAAQGQGVLPDRTSQLWTVNRPNCSRLFSTGPVPLAGRQRGHFKGTSFVIHPNMGQREWAPGPNRDASPKG